MLLAFVFLGLFCFVLGGCPPNSIGLKLNASICYSFHPSLSQYVIAERECNSFGANLVSVNNKYTNVYVTQLANLFFKHLELEQFWTNGRRLIDAKTFRWVNGDEIAYGNNLMNNRTEDDQDCMAVNLEKGFWKHEDCFTRLPFVCEFIGDDKIRVPPTAITLETFKNFEVFARVRQIYYATEYIPTTTELISKTTSTTATTTTTTTPEPTTPQLEFCPLSWTYNNATGYCYGVFHNMTWNNAEQKCIEEGAHLTSIHSKEEGLFVAKLPGESELDLGHWRHQTCIGLRTKNRGQTWQWTDGTPLNYVGWSFGEPDNSGIENCGAIWSSADNPYPVKTGEVNNCPCNLSVAHFVCKKLPS